jgi:hypothetical protein
MENQNFWRKQTNEKPLFPDIEWSKPEQRAARGKLLIVGGSTHGFAAVGKAFTVAHDAGAGEVKVALPDTLRKNLPPTIATDAIFLPSNHSGGLSREGENELVAAANWADGVLLVGDSGQNSETAVLFDAALATTDRWFTIARDAVDLLRLSGEKLCRREHTHLVLSFAQAQKLFQAVYYPKILTFSMQFSLFVEALHKFTTTYPATLTVFHQNHLVAARGGDVISQEFANSLAIIDGTVAARAAAYLPWNKTQPLEAIVASWRGGN